MDFLLYPSPFPGENQESHFSLDWLKVLECGHAQQSMAIDQSYDLTGHYDDMVCTPTQEESMLYTSDGKICMSYVNDMYYGGCPQSEDIESYNYMVQYSSHNHDASYADHYTAASNAMTTVPLSKLSTYSELMPHVLIESHRAMAKEEKASQLPTPAAPSQSVEAVQEPPQEQPSAKYPNRKTPSRPTKAKGRGNGKKNTTRTVTSVKKQCTDVHSASGSHCSYSSTSCTTVSPQDTTSKPVRDVKGDSTIMTFSIGKEKKVVKKRKRREAVSLACYFCRRRKIACRQPPEGAEDRTCGQCLSRDLDCVYPKESRRGLRRKPIVPRIVT